MVSACSNVALEVRDTTKAQGHHLHHVKVTSGSLSVGDTVTRRWMQRFARSFKSFGNALNARSTASVAR